MFNENELHDDLHVFDNASQDDAVSALYTGMTEGYVPSWDRNADLDTFGYDYKDASFEDAA